MKRMILILMLMLVGALVACQSSNSESSADLKAEATTATVPPTLGDVLAMPLSMAENNTSERQAAPTQVFLAARAMQATWTPAGPTVTPFPTSTFRPDETATLTTPGVQPTADLAADIRGDHFWLARPFFTGSGIQANVNIYHYGTTALGYQPHHGVDIENPIGTNVRAVASGRVFYAGDDLNDVVFGPQQNFYGNLVVIEHEFEVPESDGAVFHFYTLYGHLSQFFVRPGDRVEQFDEIGAVGQEGVALGPHLHLEVRIGDPYDYDATYNPNLWLQPFPGYGVLAGRALLRSGGYVQNAEVEIWQNGRLIKSTLTYHYDRVNSDPYFNENFVVPDLREGTYEVIVKYQGRTYSQTVEILSGRTTAMNQLIG